MPRKPLLDDPEAAHAAVARARRAMRWMLLGLVLLVSFAWRLIRHGAGAGAIHGLIALAMGLGLAMLLVAGRLGLRVLFGRKGRG